MSITNLTPRELEVLSLMAEGLNNKEIAEKLIVALATVKCNIHRIYAKLGLSDYSISTNRVKAVLLYNKFIEGNNETFNT